MDEGAEYLQQAANEPRALRRDEMVRVTYYYEMALQLKSHERVRACRRDAQYSTCVRIVYIETRSGSRAQKAQTSPSFKFEELKSATEDAGRSATVHASTLAAAAAALLLCWVSKTRRMRCDSEAIESRMQPKAKQAEASR